MDRALELSNVVAARLRRDRPQLAEVFNEPGQIRCCWIDNLFPDEVITSARAGLPGLECMIRRKGIKERKYVFSQVDRLGDMARALVIAFNQQTVVDCVASIMREPRLEADPCLFNGGINIMMPGDFMHPHLDNSHNYGRTQRRVAAAIYYLSDPWSSEYGGELELCDGLGQNRKVEPKRNRLVILELTDNWHGIRPIAGPKARITISTFFYTPATVVSPLRLTRYAPWPDEDRKLLKLYFDADFYLRTLVSKLAGDRRIVPNRHIYRPSLGPHASGRVDLPDAFEGRS